MRGCSKLGTIVVDRVPVVVIHAGHGGGEVRGRSVDFLVSATEEHAGPVGVKECPQAAVEDPVADEADVVRHLTEAAEREAEYLTIDAVLVESFLDRSRVVFSGAASTPRCCSLGTVAASTAAWGHSFFFRICPYDSQLPV